MLTRNDYQSAVYSQSACNGSGLIFSLAEVMKRICEEVRGGTNLRNQHPIVVMYVTQLAFLAGLGSVDTDAWRVAYHRCIRMAEHEHEFENELRGLETALPSRCLVCMLNREQVDTFDGKVAV